MKLKKSAILGIRLRPHSGELRDTNISNEGLVCGYGKRLVSNETQDDCVLGETSIETMNTDKAREVSKLKPLILKAYYTTAVYPKMPRLRAYAKEYKEAHEKFRKSFKEIPIDRDTAFWLVRRVGIKHLNKNVFAGFGAMTLTPDLDLMLYPMVEIAKMIPLLEVRSDGVLQMASKEREYIFKLSAAVDGLRSALFISEIDIDGLVEKISADKRKLLLKKIKELSKLIKL